MRLILATVALGIGVNAKALCELFPVDKPTTLQNWKGRAARTTINNNEDRKGVTEGTGNTAQPEHVEALIIKCSLLLFIWSNFKFESPR